jgi:Lar family restriction alleviation protein
MKTKRCPFCGSNGIYTKHLPIGLYCVACTKCGASSGPFLNEDDAEEAWNKRQEQFSLSDMELLRDIVEAELKSVKRDSEYRCSLLRLSIKCMDVLNDLNEGEY